MATTKFRYTYPGLSEDLDDLKDIREKKEEEEAAEDERVPPVDLCCHIVVNVLVFLNLLIAICRSFSRACSPRSSCSRPERRTRRRGMHPEARSEAQPEARSKDASVERDVAP